MRKDVARDLNDSAHAFVHLVWPAIGEKCGGGQLLPIEDEDATNVQRELDCKAGIDGWQIRQGGVMRALASRVQWERDWASFTIRLSRTTGAKTEYAKRMQAIYETEGEHNLYPALTIQAYVTERRTGTLMSAAACFTKELYEYLNRVPRIIRKNPVDGNEFLCAFWKDYKKCGGWIVTVPETSGEQGRLEFPCDSFTSLPARKHKGDEWATL